MQKQDCVLAKCQSYNIQYNGDILNFGNFCCLRWSSSSAWWLNML